MPKIPKYCIVINKLKAMIEAGELAAGSLLPAENELCTQFSVSHMTLTKAMNELAVAGYIKRIPGKGTFADGTYKTRIRKSFIRSESITDLIFNSGLKPHTEVLKYAVIKGKDQPETAQLMNIAQDAFLHYFIRARYGDDQLVCLSYTYVSQTILPTLDITRLEGSFNEYIKSLNISRSYGHTEFCATLPTPEQARIIGTDHVPLLKQTIQWNVDEQPFELTRHYFIGDKYSITQDLILKYHQDGTCNKVIRDEDESQ